jgi:hypothetical protein
MDSMRRRELLLGIVTCTSIPVTDNSYRAQILVQRDRIEPGRRNKYPQSISQAPNEKASIDFANLSPIADNTRIPAAWSPHLTLTPRRTLCGRHCFGVMGTGWDIRRLTRELSTREFFTQGRCSSREEGF